MRDENQQESNSLQSALIAPEAESGAKLLAPTLAANCATSFSTPAVSPFFDLSHGFSTMIKPTNRQQSERKRRRVHANSDNTLDGLVAKRAELEPNAKRYQTENEAIELPDDETEVKRLETDPDVATRTCSICGYQGKWVSEMVRHKRVHTSERPFKCKFCNRTSKWKADLIRHVAKTHGIRVVSKYSRSKAFDAQHSTSVSNIDENNNEVDVVELNRKDTPTASKKPSQTETQSSLIYRCLTCFFEDESMGILADHLRNVHDLAPFQCVRCHCVFDNVQHVSMHCTQTGATCNASHIKINFNLVSDQQPIAQSQLPQPQSTGGLLTVAPKPNLIGSPLSIDSDAASATSASTSVSRDIDFELNSQHVCPACPYRSNSSEKLAVHRLGHEMPRGLFNYKCVFCNWYSKRKSSIEKHMLVHTSKPQQFMPQVERNVVPSILNNGSLIPNSATSSFAAALAGRPLFGGTAASQLTPMVASAPVNDPFRLLSAVYGGVPTTATSPVAPISALSSVAQSIPSVPMADLNAFKELTTNPLLAFSLCSLLDKINPQSSTASLAAALQQANMMPSGPLSTATFEQNFL
ncbi:hypothetical protein M3Y98_00845300 [Aphelenchoides besseyi]|nr:hypothetical protein M3Y98_00845300 [Aphelenchoides besseyi]KAI6202460.1 hypothetical protein M3Y96_00951400 [Aphelenchoides besseyi]